MKTWKKIEETKKRAKEVNDLKRKNDERMMMKMEAARMTQMQQQESQYKIINMRRRKQVERMKIQ